MLVGILIEFVLDIGKNLGHIAIFNTIEFSNL